VKLLLLWLLNMIKIIIAFIDGGKQVVDAWQGWNNL
jgi:hypothetical protein